MVDFVSNINCRIIMKQIKEYPGPVAIILAVITFVGLGIWYEMEMWNECRQTNSLWYCMRILNK
jgi:hypothetical protein